MCIRDSADRWQIETLFGCLKTRGFNFEDTHLRDASRLSKMMGPVSYTHLDVYKRQGFRRPLGLQLGFFLSLSPRPVFLFGVLVGVFLGAGLRFAFGLLAGVLGGA